MSIKFKNSDGGWVKIPATDDFTKLKNVPFTTINTTNKSEFTTLKGILDHSDGMYLVDDCGVTNGDPQLTIASFKGHCSTMLLASKAQFQEITDSTEIECLKGCVIYVLSAGDVSDNSATRYVSIYNVPMGVSGEPSDLGRAFPDAGTSIVNIEIHPVEDRSSGMPVYSYDIDGGTETFFTHPGFASFLNSYANSYVAGGLISGKSSYSPGQLIQVVGDTDSWAGGCRFTGVDASEFKSPFTLITNENATNYNTLDKLCHLDDGLYLCKDTYKTNQDYIVEVTFDGISLLDATMYSFTGTEPTPDTYGSTKCKNGAIISVVTQTDNTKNKIVRITHGLNGELGGHGNGFDDVYIIAEPDDSSASTLVYGVTGANVRYFKPFNINMVYGSLFPFAAMNGTLFDGANANGKMAVWNKSESAEMPTLGYADIPTSPIIEVNDSNWNNFDTLQKWMNANAGTYLVKTTKLTVEAAGIDQTRESDNSFSRTLGIPSDTYVYVYSTDDSNSSATNYKNVVFQKADNMPSDYYGEWMIFKWDTRKTYSADNVELYPLMTAAITGAAAVQMVNELSSVVETKVDAAYVTNATKDFATNARIGDVIDLSNRNDEVTRSVIGASSLNKLKSKLNTTDKSNIVAAINELDARNDKFQENESTSVVLNNHTEYRCKVMASLNLSLPETIPDDYNSRIVFESGETATTLSYTAGSIKFIGDDCDSSNALVPATNTSYEVDIKYLGLDSSGNKRIIARVGAF